MSVSHSRVLLAHGSGGKLASELLSTIFLPPFANPILKTMDDSAVCPFMDEVSTSGGKEPLEIRVAFTTDSYVVKPLFFPGGDIGRLAVCGTVNDLSMVGANPRYLSAAFIVEEGLPTSCLRRVVGSMKKAAREAGVSIVTGDTKVVERGSVDGLFINTAGIGLVPPGRKVSGALVQEGDSVILSGPVANHGISVLLERERMGFVGTVQSDVAPLNHLVSRMFETCPNLRALRDPTRGGVATSLVEISRQSGVTIRIFEEKIPIDPDVAGACEILGYDPLYVANEGKLLAFVPRAEAPLVVEAMRSIEQGRGAVVIGEVTGGPDARVLMTTRIGGTRVVDMLSGGQFPRIC